jgi:hypothetical protein
MLPEEASGNPLDLPYRAIRMAIEQPVVGIDGRLNFLQFGSKVGYRYETFYVNTAGTPQQAVQAISTVFRDHGVRHFVGPFRNQHATTIGDWLAREMSDFPSVNFQADTSDLEDPVRFPNLVRLAFTQSMAYRALIQAFKARRWTRIVTNIKIKNKKWKRRKRYRYRIKKHSKHASLVLLVALVMVVLLALLVFLVFRFLSF